MSAQVAADLRAAAEVLERDGWCQATYHTANGCHCAEGALAAVIGQHVKPSGDELPPAGSVDLPGGWWTVRGEDVWGRRSAAECALLEYLAADVDSVAAWNDTPGLTADEVIAALRAAADRAEADQ